MIAMTKVDTLSLRLASRFQFPPAGTHTIRIFGNELELVLLRTGASR